MSDNKNLSWVYLGKNIREYNITKDYMSQIGNEIDASDSFHELSSDLRKPYLNYISALSEQSNNLNWWLSAVAYRNTTVSSTYRNLCHLKISCELIDQLASNETLIIITNLVVLESIQINRREKNPYTVNKRRNQFISSISRINYPIDLLSHRIIFLVRESFKVILATIIVRSKFTSINLNTLLISYLTSTNSSETTNFHESYFGDLAHSINKNITKLGIVPFIIRPTPYINALVKLKRSPIPMIIPHKYLSHLDILSTTVKSASMHKRRNTYPYFCNLDINNIIDSDIQSGHRKNTLPEALLMGAFIGRLQKLNWQITRCIYIFENQPWERSVCWQMRKSFPEAVLIGYQHARAPSLVLNFFLGDGEPDIAPLPNSVLTVGEYTRDSLIEGGHTPSTVKVSGSLRHILPKRSLEQDRSFKASQPILVATSISVDEAMELIRMALDLFPTPSSTDIIIKCHPQTPYSKMRKILNVNIPDHITISTEPIEALLLKSSMMIYSGSTVCFQAISFEVPIIHFRPKFEFDLDPLEKSPQLRLEAIDITSLRDQVNWMLQCGDEYKMQHKAQWNRLVSRMYSPINPDTYKAFTE